MQHVKVENRYYLKLMNKQVEVSFSAHCLLIIFGITKGNVK